MLVKEGAESQSVVLRIGARRLTCFFPYRFEDERRRLPDLLFLTNAREAKKFGRWNVAPDLRDTRHSFSDSMHLNDHYPLIFEHKGKPAGFHHQAKIQAPKYEKHIEEMQQVRNQEEPTAGLDLDKPAPMSYPNAVAAFIPDQVEIRITTRGALGVRVSFPWDSEASDFGHHFINDVVSRLRAASVWAWLYWQMFASDFNQVRELKRRRRLRVRQTEIDYYAVLDTRHIEVEAASCRTTMNELLHGGSKLTKSEQREAQRQLAGLVFMSFLWSGYTKNHVDATLLRNLSYRGDQVQFVTWRSALLYGIERPGAQPSNYDKYATDMLLGLELAFMIRCELQSQYEVLQVGVGDMLNSYRSIFKVGDRRIKGLQERAMRLSLTIAEWRHLPRHSVIEHFHDFLEGCLAAMRSTKWLDAVQELIETIDSAIVAESETWYKRTTFQLTVLLLLITFLTFLLLLVPGFAPWVRDAFDAVADWLRGR